VTAAQGRTTEGSLFARAHASVDVLYREVIKFGAVGAVAFIVDIGVFNLLRTGIIGGEHGLAEKPLTAKTISVFAATIVAWLGNRYWTFRRRRRASLRREFVLFGLMNVGGLVISLACLAFSHYVLQLTSALADNIAGNVIGLGLGTLFRFWAYRQLVFTAEDLAQELQVTGEAPERSAGVPGSDDRAGADPELALDLRDRVWSSQPSPDPVTVSSNGSAQRREA
jgi:putative flippase GtrA